ncbi:uncharacterized protein EI90DRAFT_3131421 [Cantharellus anzutake]|uniref:uncharacterized protein n=1 Tax=Cantharellus anzutake TaxID=1750568 RepID=UPI001908C38F|nr:uncharacterized protein EI90DRAFT_3131421 [Cantharellus anzutake]KAF8321884.1 hypothetical protein EI90DRAFT_3131421 [Cantharellus anzutake]
MPLGKKWKQANNLGRFSQKKLCGNTSNPATESITTPPSPEHPYVSENHTIQGQPEIDVNSDVYDSANSDTDSDSDFDETVNPAIVSKDVFTQLLCDSEKRLSHLMNVWGNIPGNKVTYPGSMINGVRSECSQCHDAAKERAISGRLQEMKKKTRIDGKKCTVLDFFSHPPPTSHTQSTPQTQPSPSALLSDSSDEYSDPALLGTSYREGDCAGIDVFVTRINEIHHTSLNIQQDSTWKHPHSEMSDIPLNIPNNSDTSIHKNQEENVEVPTNPNPASTAFLPSPRKLCLQPASSATAQRRGYKKVEINLMLQVRIQQMAQLLHLYSSGVDGGGDAGWIKISVTVANVWNRGKSYPMHLRRWCREFLDNKSLPDNPYGRWGSSILTTDEDLKETLETHLRGLGPYISAADIVNFLNTPEMKEHQGHEKPICLRTAQRWLHIMGYRWCKEKRGQYSDGHEHEDVVYYRQTMFLPTMAEYAKSTREWDINGE